MIAKDEYEIFLLDVYFVFNSRLEVRLFREKHTDTILFGRLFFIFTIFNWSLFQNRLHIWKLSQVVEERLEISTQYSTV